MRVLRLVGYSALMLVATSLLGVRSVHAEKSESDNLVTAYVEPGATENELVVSIWMANVNPIIGVTLPFKFAPNADTLKLDSILTHDGIGSEFFATAPKYEEKNQTLLMHLLLRPDSTGPKIDPIPIGQGRLARMFFSAQKKFPLKGFRMAAVELPPQNVLMFVTETVNSVLPDFELVREPAPAWPPSKDGKAAVEKP